jgi:hypothetical protein
VVDFSNRVTALVHGWRTLEFSFLEANFNGSSTSNVLSLDVDDSQLKLSQLCFVNGAWGFGHHIGSFLGLGERDDFADVVQSSEEHHPTVDTQRDTSVRRRTKAKRVEQEAKAVFSGFFINAQQSKDFLLRFRIVDSDRAAASFAAVDDEVIRLSSNRFRIAFEIG